MRCKDDEANKVSSHENFIKGEKDISTYNSNTLSLVLIEFCIEGRVAKCQRR